MNEHPLLMNILLPFIGIITILPISNKKNDVIKFIAGIVTSLQFWGALQIFFAFNRNISEIQFSEHYSWINNFSIDFFLGLDGLNISFFLLTSLIIFITVLTSRNIQKNVKGFFILLLIIDIGLVGLFTTFDLFLFLIFLGLTLFPLFLLIGLWSGPKDENIAYKYGLFSIVSFTFILFGILLIHLKSDIHTYNILEIINYVKFSSSFQIGVFIILFIGFAMLMPIFPFHTWLISIFKKAPIPVSIISAALVIKIGVYGIIRICHTLLPSASNSLAILLAIFAVINIIYGAICALGQKNLKDIFGYFTINQSGFVLLGLSAIAGGHSNNINAAVTGINGAIFHTFNHSMVVVLLLLLANIIYDKSKTNDITKLNSISRKMPVLSGIIAFSFFGAFALPGLSPFISQTFCIMGSFQISRIRIYSIISIFGIILNIAIFLRAYKIIAPNKKAEDHVFYEDITAKEFLPLLPFILIILLFGIFPNIIFSLMTNGVEQLVNLLTTQIF